MPEAPLVVAVPKGRVLAPLAKRLAPLGLAPEVLLDGDRRLVRDATLATGALRFLLLKPDDVPTYVEWGAADLGVVGRDVLLERDLDLFAPVDLGIGKCRMMVAGVPGHVPAREPIRVATKYPGIAARHFQSTGRNAEIIYVQGSVELAPLTGLADVIVDLVESGETLRQNGLRETELVCDVSSVVVANRTSYKLKRDAIAPVLAALRSSSGT